MGFRGYGDDAMKVAADQRQASVQLASIAASERASKRGAANQAASIAENARQADMANTRAGENLSENARQANMADTRASNQLIVADAEHQDTMGLKREELDTQRIVAQDNQDIKRQGVELGNRKLAADMRNKQVDQAVKIAGVDQKERQLRLNESTFTKAQMEAQRLKDAQDEMDQVGTAAQLAAVRAAVVSDSPLPMPFINPINDAAGVAYGEPGSVTMIVPVIDPNTNARLGVGVRKIGKDGKPVDTIMDPMTLFPKLRASMSPESWMKFVGEVQGGQKSRGNDRTTVGMQQEHTKFEKDRIAALTAERTRLAGDSKTMLRDDAEQAKTKIAKITGMVDTALGLEDPAPKAPTSDFGKLTADSPAGSPAPAAKPAAAAKVQPSAVRLAGGKIRVKTPTGEIRDLPDDAKTAKFLASVNLEITE